jgi:hypothetical protein
VTCAVDSAVDNPRHDRIDLGPADANVLEQVIGDLLQLAPHRSDTNGAMQAAEQTADESQAAWGSDIRHARNRVVEDDVGHGILLLKFDRCGARLLGASPGFVGANVGAIV